MRTIKAFEVIASRFPATRDSARKLLEEVPPTEPVILDLSDIDHPSRSFVDELLTLCEARPVKPELRSPSPAAARMIQAVQASRARRDSVFRPT